MAAWTTVAILGFSLLLLFRSINRARSRRRRSFDELLWWQYTRHREHWVADGRPRMQVRSGEDPELMSGDLLATVFLQMYWCRRTPDWTRDDPVAERLVAAFRWTAFNTWILQMAAFIVGTALVLLSWMILIG